MSVLGIWDQTFVDACAAGEREARALGASQFGSEHALLGVLSTDAALAERLRAAAPSLDVAVLREVVRRELDHPPPIGGDRFGLRHAEELQTALNVSAAKLRTLEKSGEIRLASRVNAAGLVLAALEPAARATVLLQAIGVDPAALRPVALAALSTDGTIPVWPDEAPGGRLTRLRDRFWQRLVASPARAD